VCGELSRDDGLYGVDWIHLMDAEMGIIMRPDHPLAEKPMDAGHLAGQTWILYQHDDRLLTALDIFMGRAKHAYTVALTTSSHATGLRVVSSTDYLMIGPAQLAPVIAEDGLIVRKPATPIRQFATGMAVRRSSRAIPIVARLIELLTASTRQQVEAGGLAMP
jgi:DNA-binding transcriptional LysR family regulator